MYKKTIGILLSSASCMFAAENNGNHRFDVLDTEVAHYMRGRAAVPCENRLQNERMPLSVRSPGECLTQCHEPRAQTTAIEVTAEVAVEVPVENLYTLRDSEAQGYVRARNLDAALDVYSRALQDEGISRSYISYCEDQKINVIKQYVAMLYMENISAANHFLNNNTNFTKLSSSQKATILCDTSKVLLAQGNVTGAGHAIDSSLLVLPKKYYLRNQLIAVLKVQNDWRAALRQYQHAVIFCKPSPSQKFFAYLEMAKIYYNELHDVESAKKSLQEAKLVYSKVTTDQRLKYNAFAAQLSNAQN